MANDMGETAVRDILNGNEGARHVTSLPIFPCYYRDREDGGKTRAELERRGQKNFEISRAQPKQMFYNGYQFGVRKQWMT